ncbi:CPBP family intramembrane glutamic endopeptidase [Chitinophaga vietnamensis]|uniref:CPBP family intramembrane glutamic endopeptidase n=1 Tax=Chitinophaga vietnamensis TaxID=2593957 RepID=UPI001177E1A2|nr:CPBP family intramembrane glutamic endopeptidase [Chitinophaga vietnamensis]
MAGYLRKYPTLLQFVVFIFFFIGFMMIYLLLLNTVLPSLTGFTINDIQDGDLSNPKLVGYLKITQFFYSIVVYLVAPLLFAWLWQPKPLAYCGLSRVPGLSQAIRATLLLFCTLAVAAVLGDWNQSWHVPKEARLLQEKAEMLTKAMLRMPSATDLFFNLILIGLVPAIAEELCFRGVLQRLMINMTRMRWLSVLFTAIIFSAIHGEILGFIPRIALGFTLGAIYLVTGNLWLSILAHFVNNGMQVVLVYLFQHGFTHSDPNKESTPGWYYVVLSVAVGVILFYRLAQKAEPGMVLRPEENIK